jgi:hypothetical protein
MWPQYKDWIYHGKRPVRAPVKGSNLNPPTANVSASIDQGGNMHTMFCDLFGMHTVREDNCEPQLGVQGDEEHLVDDEADGSDRKKKYKDLLKKEDKLLHGKTRHSKLSATVHLYNLKCMGGVSNTTFSAFL